MKQTWVCALDNSPMLKSKHVLQRVQHGPQMLFFSSKNGNSRMNSLGNSSPGWVPGPHQRLPTPDDHWRVRPTAPVLQASLGRNQHLATTKNFQPRSERRESGCVASSIAIPMAPQYARKKMGTDFTILFTQCHKPIVVTDIPPTTLSVGYTNIIGLG